MDPMSRSEFLERSWQLGVGCCGMLLASGAASREARPAEPAAASPLPPALPARPDPSAGASPGSSPPEPPELARIRSDARFVEGWLADLLDAMSVQLDEKTRIALVEACGRGCYRRHPFKQEMVAEAHGTIEGLIAAYARRFEVWREGALVHVRYGRVSRGCYCPVLRDQPHRPDALHCHCTKATHRTIFEEALGRPVVVDILETVRRGGTTCHFVAHV